MSYSPQAVPIRIHVAVDETPIQLNDKRYWLYVAVDTDANRLIHVRLYPTRTQALTEMILSAVVNRQTELDFTGSATA